MARRDDVKGGQVIGKAKCACCGHAAPVKLNKNLIAYYYCNGNIDTPDASFAACSGHQKWGVYMSDQMIDAYLKSKQPANDNRPPEPPKAAAKPIEQKENDNGQPAGLHPDAEIPSNAAGGSLGGIGKALFGGDWSE